MLFATTVNYRDHSSLLIRRYVFGDDRHIRNVFAVEIHGTNRQKIAVAVLNNYPLKLHILRTIGLVALIEADEEEEIFNTLKKLQALRSRINRTSEFYALLENPTLENLKNFLGVKKLVEG